MGTQGKSLISFVLRDCIQIVKGPGKAALCGSIFAIALSIPSISIANTATQLDTWTASGGTGFNNSWSGLGGSTTSFLAAGLGGTTAGIGPGQAGQEAVRDFRSNTAGIDVANETYYLQLAFRVENLTLPAQTSGSLEIFDGFQGSNNAFDVGFSTSRNNGSFAFFARDYTGGGSGTIVNLQLDNGLPGQALLFKFDTNYVLDISLNPLTRLYNIKVTELNGSNGVVATASKTNVAAGGTVIQNNQNGRLGFYNSNNNTRSLIDELRISDAPIAPLVVPEPALTALAAAAFALVVFRRRRS